MTLQVYSTAVDPQRLYTSGDAEGGSQFVESVTDLVRTGEQPPDLLADLDAQRLLWLFHGQRTTTSTRTGYFIGDYHAENGGDLFEGFADALHDLHHDPDWELPYTNDPQWDAGFNLWRVDGQYPGLAAEEVEGLHTALESTATRSEPLIFGMADTVAALQTLKALHADNIPCRVAIDTAGLEQVDADLVLQPGSSANFTPRSSAAKATITPTTSTGGSVGQTHQSSVSNGVTTDQYERDSFAGRIAGGILLIILGVSLYSFLSLRPVHPITGLAAVGGFVGSLAGYVLVCVPWSGTVDSYLPAIRAQLVGDSDRVFGVLAYGTGLAFLFPTVFRVSGVMATGSNWLIGSATRVVPSLIYTTVFVTVLFGINLVILSKVSAFATERQQSQFHRRVGLAHGLYAVVVFFMTGLAASFWSYIIPSL